MGEERPRKKERMFCPEHLEPCRKNPSGTRKHKSSFRCFMFEMSLRHLASNRICEPGFQTPKQSSRLLMWELLL